MKKWVGFIKKNWGNHQFCNPILGWCHVLTVDARRLSLQPAKNSAPSCMKIQRRIGRNRVPRLADLPKNPTWRGWRWNPVATTSRYPAMTLGYGCLFPRWPYIIDIYIYIISFDMFWLSKWLENHESWMLQEVSELIPDHCQIGWGKIRYPLVNEQFAIENDHLQLIYH